MAGSTLYNKLKKSIVKVPDDNREPLHEIFLNRYKVGLQYFPGIRHTHYQGVIVPDRIWQAYKINESVFQLSVIGQRFVHEFVCEYLSSYDSLPESLVKVTTNMEKRLYEKYMIMRKCASSKWHYCLLTNVELAMFPEHEKFPPPIELGLYEATKDNSDHQNDLEMFSTYSNNFFETLDFLK